TPPRDVFTVHFHGTFIPVQGIPYIVEAAEILRNEEIHFRFVGHGPETAKIDSMVREKGLTNIERIPKVPVEKIPGYIADSDVVLGLFSSVEKAMRAIPNKVYEAMAMGRAIITEDGSGIRELRDSQDVFMLVPPADAKALAQAILSLKKDGAKR